MHGTVYANNAANEADLLLAIGVRFDDRVTGKVEKFCEHGTIVHIDIDNSELNKNRLVKLPILSDLKYALTRLNGHPRQDGPQARPEEVHPLSGVVSPDRRLEDQVPALLQGHGGRHPAPACHQRCFVR